MSNQSNGSGTATEQVGTIKTSGESATDKIKQANG